MIRLLLPLAGIVAFFFLSLATVRLLQPRDPKRYFLAYALLNSPQVQAAYFDWAASVENITVTRSYPDPQLTFQAYIQDIVTSLMPGFAWSIPGPGKLKAP